ncbi:sensor histidine kinase [Treponema brennaborense]|uniref:histidine kinase n=1 Tax=Treponema brennaborense (strain DSM 12168 / CIP 105900 / DD5/3) TaxID=906968 RepID=F4LLA0_TREBD|nr:ATP-binding protein [Treponema brennaborense]AEE15578.1 putative signal transduction histidine kinase [Treponema brennaborense DSM 12168]
MKEHYQKRHSYVTAGITLLFILLAYVLFLIKYRIRTRIPLVFENDVAGNSFLFYVNFYVPLLTASLTLAGAFFNDRWFPRLLFCSAGIFSATLSAYTVPDLFTIKFAICASHVVAYTVFPFPQNIAYPTATLFLFSAALFHPDQLGKGNISLKQFNPTVPEALFFYVLVLLFWGGALYSKRLSKYCDTFRETVAHLHLTETQLAAVNQHLQENAKTRGEQASKRERSRITRDMHDSCGYVFTNIIALSDAAMSTANMDDQYAHRMFQLIRTQAADGLKHTREILHLIRNIQDPVATGIQDIYQLKTIFEEVTGISIDIETGNMEHEYGRAVNSTLRKIIREAFTNSLRHGHATHILIHFQEFEGNLTITVSDNGIGAKQIVKGIGFAGMEERLREIGGTLSFFSPEDGGFRLIISIPLTGAESEFGGAGDTHDD